MEFQSLVIGTIGIWIMLAAIYTPLIWFLFDSQGGE